MWDKSNTLFVFEGRETEDNIVSKLEKNLMGETLAIKCVYGSDIYQLYRKLKEEDFAIDIVSFLKSRSAYNRKMLEGYDNDSFAYVYFFFDYDAHATLASDEQIAEMLEFFNNETENGKLFISYPMVEAIKHFKDKASFQHLAVKCKRANCPHIADCPHDRICMVEPHYKTLVPTDNDKEYAKLDSPEKWKKLVDAHLCKANDIVNGEYSRPKALILQADIFAHQVERFVSQDCPLVAVLSAFPLFAQDYFGVETLDRKLNTIR